MNVMMLKILFSLIISFLITFYLVPLLCTLAVRLKFVDVPDGKIKRHTQTTPYMGGVAVYIGFISALAFTFPMENQIFLLLVGSTLLLFIGLVDDLIVLKPSQKFFGQFMVVLCYLKAGLYLKEQFFYNYWNIPLSIFWMLSVINAFNLVDVMDGLASGLAICATLSFMAIAYYFNQLVLLILLAAFLGALIGFFWHNRPTAKIYLGDAGSLFIGGFLAVIPFLLNWGTYSWYGYLAPAIILGVPLIEVLGLIVIRSYKKIPFYKGSPDHFSIYLQQSGWTKYGILGYASFLSLVLFGGAFLIVTDAIAFPGIVFFGSLIGVFWFATVPYKLLQ